MKYPLVTALATSLLLTGCLGSASQTVKGFIPSKLDATQTVLNQTSRQYMPGGLVIGEEQDRRRNQSLGLGLVSHPAAETHLNEQLVRLKKASGIANVPGRVYLFADTSLGAKVTPDGNIYVPYGVLTELGSTDEAAAMLARQLAHVVRGHSNIEMLAGLQEKAVSATALFATLKQDTFGNLAPKNQQQLDGVMSSLMVSDGFIDPGWTDRQEEEADKLGVDLLVAAGYNAHAMFTLLGKKTAWESHNQQHQAQGSALVQKALASASIDTSTLPFGQMLDGVIGQSVNAAGALLGNLNQGAAEKRQQELQAYVSRHYADAPRSEINTRTWERITQSQQSKNISKGLAHVIQAREAMLAGDLAASERSLRLAANRDTNSQNFLRQPFFELRAEQQQTRGMQQNLAFALKGDYPSLKMYVEQARLTPQGKKNKAEALMKVFDQFGRPPEYYGEVINLANTAGVDTNALLADCLANYSKQGVSCAKKAVGGEQGAASPYMNVLNSLLE